MVSGVHCAYRQVLLENFSRVVRHSVDDKVLLADGVAVNIQNVRNAVHLLEKRVGVKLLQKDVFLNIAGGLRVDDTAIDLAVLAAVLSSNMDIALDAATCLCGEVGLAGEIRSVNRIEQRIAEAQKLGFKRIIIPADQKGDFSRFSIEVVPVRKVTDAFRLLIKA